MMWGWGHAWGWSWGGWYYLMWGWHLFVWILLTIVLAGGAVLVFRALVRSPGKRQLERLRTGGLGKVLDGEGNPMRRLILGVGLAALLAVAPAVRADDAHHPAQTLAQQPPPGQQAQPGMPGPGMMGPGMMGPGMMGGPRGPMGDGPTGFMGPGMMGRGEGMMGMMFGRGAARHGAAWAQALGLTPEQRAQVRSLRFAFMKKVIPLRAQVAMARLEIAEQFRRAEPDLRAAEAALRTAAEKRVELGLLSLRLHQDVVKALTPDQRKRLEGLY